MNLTLLKRLEQFIIKFIANKCRSLHKEIILIFRKFKNLLSTNIEIGLYHFYKGNVSDAKLRFWLISIFCPDLPVIWYNIGRCYFTMGDINKAHTYLTKTLKLDSNHEEASYYIKKIVDPKSIKELPKNLIKQYFDYSGEYFIKHWLIAKQYNGHELIYMAITQTFKNFISKLKILDLGCGTGICCYFLKRHNTGDYITGVDISNRMLDIAKECVIQGESVYDELIHAKITDFLKQNRAFLYDVIIFSEVLHYLYDFLVELELAKKSISRDGVIICLIRRKDGEGVDFINEGDYFCHSESYIKYVAKKINMQVGYMSYCKIYGNQINGILFTLRHSQRNLEI